MTFSLIFSYFSRIALESKRMRCFAFLAILLLYKVLTEKSHKILGSYATISVSAVIGTLWQCRADGCHYHPRCTSKKYRRLPLQKRFRHIIPNRRKPFPISIYPTIHLLRLPSDNDRDNVFLAIFSIFRLPDDTEV